VWMPIAAARRGLGGHSGWGEHRTPLRHSGVPTTGRLSAISLPEPTVVGSGGRTAYPHTPPLGLRGLGCPGRVRPAGNRQLRTTGSLGVAGLTIRIFFISAEGTAPLGRPRASLSVGRSGPVTDRPGMDPRRLGSASAELPPHRCPTRLSPRWGNLSFISSTRRNQAVGSPPKPGRGTRGVPR
jgi:hypothetical protein